MLRGRRVVFFVAFICIFLPLFAPVFGNEMSVTATVPVSPIWKEAIEKYSLITINSKELRNITKINIEIKGFEGVTLPNQNIQALLFAQDTLVASQEKTTDTQGKAFMSFVHRRGIPYRLIILHTSNSDLYVIRSLAFTP